MCESGSFTIKCKGGSEVVKKGEVVLLPSEIENFDLVCNGNEKAALIEVLL
jgi:mannose-6-phosphate isomerase-like protein (cupin superfamily)